MKHYLTTLTACLLLCVQVFAAAAEKTQHPRHPRRRSRLWRCAVLQSAARQDPDAATSTGSRRRACGSRTRHSSSGVCSPSRYSLLTGRYHWRTRLQRGIVGVFGEPSDRAGPHDHRHAGEAKRLPHGGDRQMASRMGLADREGAEDALRHRKWPARMMRRSRSGGPPWRRRNRWSSGASCSRNPSPVVRRHAVSTPISAPTCRTGRRIVLSKTTGRSAFRASFCPSLTSVTTGQASRGRR